MQFDSLAYLALMVATFVAFFAVPVRVRPWVMLAATAVFYGAWSVKFLGLVVISALVDFACGLLLERVPERRRFPVLMLSMVTNLGILGYFKYANFFIASLHAVVGDVVSRGTLEVVLPPGISFYTFQTMSYTIDVYRRDIRPTHSLVRFMVYVGFFPQLVAGPIERAGHLLSQFQYAFAARASFANLVSGSQMIFWGLFKKLVIADHCAALVEPVYSGFVDGGTPPDGWAALVATYAFTLQIYCDFSAYSEIAQGSARIFGIELMQNFDQPYLVGNVREFWRHWHISLSTWFRDYVYRPLGGNRRGPARTLINLVVTMFLSGLWHGAAWTFVVWGLYHGGLLLVHGLLEHRAPVVALRRNLGRLWSITAVLITFHAIVVGWVLFRADTLSGAAAILGSIVRAPSSGPPRASQLAFFAGVAAFLVLSALARRLRWRERLDARPIASVIGYSTIILAALVLGAESGPQFIYFQF